MKYMIEFELPDNDTVQREIKTADVAWGIWGYRGYTKARPVQGWIPCSERLPEVSYDALGNWSSDSALLFFKDGHYDIGYFNPCGVFEIYDIGNECSVAVGTVRKADEAWQIVAWMPLPKPYRGGTT